MILAILSPPVARLAIFALLARTGLMGLLFVGLLSEAQAASSVTLSWDGSISSGIAGYRVYYGTSIVNYSQVIDVMEMVEMTFSG
jgi:hypothetical protein